MSFDAAPPPLPDWLLRRLPCERRAFTLEAGPDAGRRLHLIDHGPRDGPIVWMQHGNPTWSFLWREVIARLPRARCVAPDLLGFGLSSSLPRPGDHRIARHLDALEQLFLALVPAGARVVLVGQDWGGPLAAGLGARHPDRIAGLVLGNTSVLVPPRPRGTLFHRFARAPLVSDLAFRVLGFPQRGGFLARAQGDRSSIAGEVAAAYRWPLRHLRDRAGPLGLARMVPDSLEHPSVAALRPIEAWVRSFSGPSALVWGERDPILGRLLGKHHDALPRATVTRTQAGHFLQEEVPDAIARAIDGVLSSQTDSDPRRPG
jgi:pimeloyl-ACP methyl ester carboxylesterase